MLPEANGRACDGLLGRGINYCSRNWRRDGVAKDEATLSAYKNHETQSEN